MVLKVSRWKVYLNRLSMWTKFIGWFQMGVCLVILHLLYRTVKRLQKSTDDSTYWHGRMLNYKAKQSVIVFSTIDIIRTSLTAFFSIVLLVGAYNKNVNHLMVWIEFTCLLKGFYVISTIVQGIELEMLDLLSISQCAAIVIVHLFLVSVVFRYKEKLEAENRIKLAYAID